MFNINIFEKLSNAVWNGRYSKDVGAALIHLGAAGWVLSAAAQIGMLARNKDIDPKEKKFLIPQEIADGVINVGLYYTICQSIKGLGNKVVENGWYITQKTNNLLKIMNPDDWPKCNVIQGFAERFFDTGITTVKKQKLRLSAFLDGSINYIKGINIPADFVLSNAMKTAFDKLKAGRTVEEQIDLLKDVQRNFNNYKNGVGVIAAVGASVLACNLITPIARNITANYYQRRLIKENHRLHKPSATESVNKPFQYTDYKTAVFNMPKSNTFTTFHI